MKIDPAAVQQLLYDHEMAYSLTARWDTGFTAELLTHYSPMPVSPAFGTLAEAVDWLAAEAIRRHPHSVFAAKYQAISGGADDPGTPNTER